MGKPARKAALQTLGLMGMLLMALVMTACKSSVDERSTAVSLTVRPVPTVQAANSNTDPNTLPTDPTRPAGQFDATGTPGRATATLAAPGANNTPAPANNSGGAATNNQGVPQATTASGGGTPATNAGGGAGNAQTGLTVFRRVGCTSCHLNNGRNAGGQGPQLTVSQNAGNADYIRTIVRNGKGAMQPYDKDVVSDADLDNIVAYILSIRAK